MRKSSFLLVLCLIWAGSAAAQFISQRFLPAQGERGRLGETQALPMVKIGSRVLRLAPGALIYDQQNRSIVHADLPPSVDVYYTKDTAGNVTRIYILTEQERTRLNASGKR
ncbi:MAG: hypothetical protein ACXWUH_15680 [Burkholderiales bacterium]